jgi:tetratricopeptide (TPR) repeat protein
MAKPQRGRTREPHDGSSNHIPEVPPVRHAHVSPGNSPSQGAQAPNGPNSGRRATYPEAVARYEHGMLALQEHRYQQAAEAFRSVLSQYPEEKELNDRVRLYLALCERHLRTAPEPKTLEERLYAATLALNAGDGETALRHLGDVVAQDPNHDGALYMLAVAHALKDDSANAFLYLQQAIERNPDNRALALQDGDLERLMQDESIRAALEGGAGRAGDGRIPPRPRPLR